LHGEYFIAPEEQPSQKAAATTWSLVKYDQDYSADFKGKKFSTLDADLQVAHHCYIHNRKSHPLKQVAF